MRSEIENNITLNRNCMCPRDVNIDYNNIYVICFYKEYYNYKIKTKHYVQAKCYLFMMKIVKGIIEVPWKTVKTVRHFGYNFFISVCGCLKHKRCYLCRCTMVKQ